MEGGVPYGEDVNVVSNVNASLALSHNVQNTVSLEHNPLFFSDLCNICVLRSLGSESNIVVYRDITDSSSFHVGKPVFYPLGY